MNKLKKLIYLAGFSVSTIATAKVVNDCIFKLSTADNLTYNRNSKKYKWRFGDISYTVTGTGHPLLLIHELDSTGSSYEWNRVVKKLSKKYKVFTIDLLGCGFSDKPHITYTAYLYTQLLNDFIVNVIKTKVDVIATGASASLTIMSSYNNPYLFNKIMLVSPDKLTDKMVFPDKKCEIRRDMLNTPIIGTMLYNLLMSQHSINNKLNTKKFASGNMIPKETYNAYHEIAHLGNANSKYLYASTENNYTTTVIANAISQIDNCIHIISGDKEESINATIRSYTNINPAIEYTLLKESKHLPQIEQPEEFIKAVFDFFK